jgi:pSer/pThr/pTyr-binding forkhead associated (FHA) protein
MTKRDKTHTVHIPGNTEPKGVGRSPNLDTVETQVLTDNSGMGVAQLTVIDGPGKGQSRPVFSGTNQVGRHADNRIPLDFGDNTISRHQHAVITYNAANQAFKIYDGGKQNPIAVNGEKLSGEQSLKDGDVLKIGVTTLRFNVG